MHTQEDARIVQELIIQYAKVLNEADALSIPAFYSEDGLLMPHAFKTLSGKNLAASGAGWLKKNAFHIDYTIQHITVDNKYAFAEADAVVKQTDPLTNREIVKTSRDFFVLRKERENWKIYRYLFNNVKQQ
ncbi:ketosteroid isomerase-like protein [Filimonas zeae]|uniref:SnoaL-like domain-containing protein n=1 Tax=Filimonas zeae TaxID=1737353 RepID=A0A917IPE0_9BACT|nr:nuclear transport factor 2 family protein [Filimonas zeae]MDR6337721.1 ketosteroid isomerase-like protein [Filimonas zeae]GGH59943.1 hypothetical protein GCM10011379_07280 [Filimonas zeae]